MNPLWRSLLFVPATRPDRFEKAAAAGADMVCIDLEDAVATADKETARDTALGYLAGSLPAGPRWVLRINSPRTELGLHDLLALLSSEAAPDALFIPKASSGEEMRWLDDLLSAADRNIDLLPVIESAEGLDRAVEIAGSVLRNVALGFGSADYAAELGSDMSVAALAYGRGRIAAAAGQAGIAAIDGIWPDFKDDEGLRGDTELIRSMGFDGKIAIHPRQVSVIHAVFAPGEEEVARARRIVAASEAANGGIATVDGEMIDNPVVVAAQHIIAAARAAAKDD
ncbi:MAG: CoA ester lyase [Rhodospirillaceae bacterium]|jgi:(S)-citramalyl-CoA lyase|nr:CoA ester lyase [Rhodospirillaceae bacterium]MBT3807949.1 CoA ester lyase [Rhodospirillaceae bacterium]MBT4772365.1 CoA ester lyase [Rhodospirillaceae bacterium]MBT5359657.1 CoA ester lyase [Rhodospirillaceae bacterium]MBT5769885.1 CoA ester lyase [Rhodospirillaceae bacterium]